jgi:hypothetical protein
VTGCAVSIDFGAAFDMAAVSIFDLQGHRLCSAPASLENSGTRIARFDAHMPAGHYIVRISACGRESSGSFYLTRL